MKISVVMPVHNEEAYLPYSLPSLKRIEHYFCEVIFVLDNCTDKSKTIIQKHFPEATIYEKQEHKWNFYAAEAFQYGFDRASGDIIWALAADLIFDPVIPNIIKNVFADEKIGTVCFRYLNYDLFNHWNMVKGSYDNVYKTIMQYFRREARHTGVYAFRRQMMLEIGGLADIVSEYDEFCRRVTKNGWKLVYVPSTHLLHLRPGLTAKKQYMQGVARFYLPSYNLSKTLLHSFVHLKPYLITGYLHAKHYGVELAGSLR